MKLIDEVDVKMALEKGTSDLKIIHKRILDLHDELIEVDSVIRSVAMKSPTEYEKDNSRRISYNL